jgi:hypothetical protein
MTTAATHKMRVVNKTLAFNVRAAATRSSSVRDDGYSP